MLADLLDALSVAVQVRQPTLLWGPPGEGKTSVVASLAGVLGRRCEVVVGSLREASDFCGIPYRTLDGIELAPPAWALRCVEDPGTLLFLDELTTAEPQVQAAMLRVVLERVVGDLRLPEQVSIVAAANPPELSPGGTELSAPLANRFLHLEFTYSAHEWVEGLRSGWSPQTSELVVPSDYEVTHMRWRRVLASYISARPAVLRQLPRTVEEQGRAWPSPRSWERAAELAAAAEAAGAASAVVSLLVGGLVGRGAAIELLAFARRADLLDPALVLDDPHLLDLDLRAEQLLNLLQGFSNMIRAEPRLDWWGSAWVVIERLADHGLEDVAAKGAMGLMAVRREGWNVPSVVARFADLISFDGP